MRYVLVFDMVKLSMKKYTFALLLGLLIFALPMFFISFNVTLAFGTESVYMYSVDNYEVVEKTGIDRQALTTAMQGMVAFFKGGIDISEVLVNANGELQPLFSQNEQLHFDDVRDILDMIRMSLYISGLFILCSLITLLYCVIRNYRPQIDMILGCFKYSALTVTTIFAVLGVVSLMGGFDYLFYWFHILSFSNDLWMGTESSRMVQLFPSEFFMHVSIMIALATCLEMATLFLGCRSIVRIAHIGERRVYL
tara:strand:- start:3090 stop:3845 length:756 start_codon:yes stop_codon:yes gene_type:complete